MKINGKLKEEKGISALGAILLGVILVLVIIIIVSIVKFAGDSVKTLQDLQTRDEKQAQNMMSSVGM